MTLCACLNRSLCSDLPVTLTFRAGLFDRGPADFYVPILMIKVVLHILDYCLDGRSQCHFAAKDCAFLACDPAKIDFSSKHTFFHCFNSCALIFLTLQLSEPVKITLQLFLIRCKIICLDPLHVQANGAAYPVLHLA